MASLLKSVFFLLGSGEEKSPDRFSLCRVCAFSRVWQGEEGSQTIQCFFQVIYMKRADTFVTFLEGVLEGHFFNIVVVDFSKV